MKVLIVDISGKIPLYDEALYNNLIQIKNCSCEIYFIAPFYSLRDKNISDFFSFSKNDIFGRCLRFVKIVKAILCLMNYIKLVFVINRIKPNIIHFQWLPFLEFSLLEYYFLKIFKMVSPKSKLLLTIHNVYPHNLNCKKKERYNKRFRIISKIINAFIVHTKVAKDEVTREFGVSEKKINVCFHGVFEPSQMGLKVACRDSYKLKILQFGVQSFYKGTDLLVEAVNSLDSIYRMKLETCIAGPISPLFLSDLKSKDVNCAISWKPYLLKEKELYAEINNSDIIILPYREISQSGVLLLSIYFEKLILCSDLPSFVETMRGFDGDELDKYIFFKRNDVDDLKKLLMLYIDGCIDCKSIYYRIKSLKKLYSWNNAAKMTLLLYKKMNSLQ